MSAQYTLGPWEAIKASHGPIDVFDPNGRDIVTVYGNAVCAISQEANARLIAAAPELLEALRGMLEGYAWDHEKTAREQGEYQLVSYVRIARNAIAKAEGRA
jgi:hypothetical protein